MRVNGKVFGLEMLGGVVEGVIIEQNGARMERSASMFAGKRPMLVSRVATMFK